MEAVEFVLSRHFSGRYFRLAAWCYFYPSSEAMLPSKGEPDESKTTRLIHFDLYRILLDNAWTCANVTAKSASAALQHRQAETERGQADCGRHRLLS
jgi:hypothetical protein